MRTELKAVLGAGALMGIGVAVGTLALGGEEAPEAPPADLAAAPVVSVYKTPT